MYLYFVALFFLTVIMGCLAGVLALFKRFRFLKIYAVWLVIYGAFILFGTGPVGARVPGASSYRLPWKTGVRRFVYQGNRSFTTHRGLHLNAWDFAMSIGTEILAARDGTVGEIEQSFDGIGIKSNFVSVVHGDGSRAIYAHIEKNGALVKPGDIVKQGQPIAYSGMVGQTINPHLHFVVLNKLGTESLPITFSDVPGGVPCAGHSYTAK